MPNLNLTKKQLELTIDLYSYNNKYKNRLL